MKSVHQLEGGIDTAGEDDDGALSESLLLYSISIDSVDGGISPWFEDIDVKNIPIHFKLDSGADASVMSLKSFKEAGFSECILKKNGTYIHFFNYERLARPSFRWLVILNQS